jgi:hypothetical protein
MKLRLKGNTARVRLTQSEVARLREQGAVEESVEFGDGTALRYRVESASSAAAMHATFADGVITIQVPPAMVQSWALGADIGIYSRSGPLDVSIEKDFRCLSREHGSEPDAYPNPSEGSRC